MNPESNFLQEFLDKTTKPNRSASTSAQPQPIGPSSNATASFLSLLGREGLMSPPQTHSVPPSASFPYAPSPKSSSSQLAHSSSIPFIQGTAVHIVGNKEDAAPPASEQLRIESQWRYGYEGNLAREHLLSQTTDFAPLTSLSSLPKFSYAIEFPNEESIYNGPLDVQAISHVNSELKKRMSKLLAVSPHFICYPVKEKKIRVLSQIDAHRNVLSKHTCKIVNIQLFSHDDLLLSTDDENNIIFWDMKTKAFQTNAQPLHQMKWSARVVSIVQHPLHGHKFMIADENGSITLFDLDSKQIELNMNVESNLLNAAFGRNEKDVIVCFEDAVKIYEGFVSNAKISISMESSPDTAFLIYKSRDVEYSELLLTSQANCTHFKLWSLPQGQLLHSLNFEHSIDGYCQKMEFISAENIMTISCPARHSVFLIQLSVQNLRSGCFASLTELPLNQPAFDLGYVEQYPNLSLYMIGSQTIQQVILPRPLLNSLASVESTGEGIAASTPFNSDREAKSSMESFENRKVIPSTTSSTTFESFHTSSKSLAPIAVPSTSSDDRSLEDRIASKVVKYVQKMIEKNNEKLERERREREQLEMERQEQVLKAVSDTLNNNLTALLENIVQNEIKSSLTSVIEKSMKEILTKSQKSVKIDQSELKEAVAKVVQLSFEGQIAPAFETATKELFSQMTIALKTGLDQIILASPTYGSNIFSRNHSIENIVGGRLSRSPPVEDITDKIRSLIKHKRFNQAFLTAIYTDKAENVIIVCEMVNLKECFKKNDLETSVMLSIIPYLSRDLSEKTHLKFTWLKELLQYLDEDDPSLSGHIHDVLSTAHVSIKKWQEEAHIADAELTKSVKFVMKLLKSMEK